MELEDVLWHDIAEANLEHDVAREHLLCDEMHALIPEPRACSVPGQVPQLRVTQDDREDGQEH